MAVPFSNTRLRVPQGFQGLLEGLAKEILHMQPNDIYAFSAIYFENLLQLQGSGNINPVSQLSHLQDRMYNNSTFQNPGINTNDKEQQKAAVKIQTKYRQHQSKDIVDQMRKEKATAKIQAGVRGYLGRKQVRRMRQELSAPTEHEFAHEEKAHEEATQEDEFKINKEEERMMFEEEKGLIDSRATAATKIQAGFRGMRLRQEIKDYEIYGKKPARDEYKRKGQEKTGKTEKEALEYMRIDATKSIVTSQDLEQEDDPVKELEIDENDAETRKAIIEIQNSLRGLKTRFENEDNEENDKPSSAMEAAATKIQAGYKGMKVRKQLQANRKDSEADEEMETAATKIQAGYKGMKVRKQLQATRKDSEADEEMETAATKIQAGYKGMKVRKQLQANRKDSETDEEMETAATKIQAGYKGMKVRKQLQVDGKNSETDDEVEAAATKIQAGFKGMKARQQLNARRLEISVDKTEPDNDFVKEH